MLALKSILSEADLTPTLVFDEVDVGVGGRSGGVVGEKLWGLTGSHQVLVHYPPAPDSGLRRQPFQNHQASDRRPHPHPGRGTLPRKPQEQEIAAMIGGTPVSAGLPRKRA